MFFYKELRGDILQKKIFKMNALYFSRIQESVNITKFIHKKFDENYLWRLPPRVPRCSVSYRYDGLGVDGYNGGRRSSNYLHRGVIDNGCG